MTQFTTRRATSQDLDFAWLLYRALMKPLTEEVMRWHDMNQRRIIEGDINSGDAAIILVAADAAGWFLRRHEPDTVRLGQLYVAAHMQNRGIGTSIVQQTLQEARSRNVPVTLEVMKNNRACAFYERLGFTVTAESKFKLHMICR